jgi:serine/threonine protein kinase
LIERLAATGEPLAEPAVWHIARELAAALSAAHSAALDDDLVTVCHGFLAPSWVWLSWDGAVGLDALGLAAVADVPGLRAPSNYDAPERRRGGKPNSRGDIYSLGAIVLALLTGEEPVEEPSLASLPQSVPEAVRMVVERAIEPALAKRKLTAAEFEMAFAELAGVDGRKALATALVRLRKGTNVLGTFQRPVALPPRVGAAGPTPSPSTPPSGIPLPRPAGAPLGTMLGAGPPRPAIPRPGGPLPTPSSSPPGSAPLGVRPPPARTMLGIAVPKPPAPTSPEPSSPPAASSQPEVPAPPQAEPAVAAPAPTSRPSVALDDEPPPPSIRPRLPSISQGRRVTKSSFAIEDELSWGGGKTDDIARAVDAALLDDIVAPTGASPSEPSAPTSSRAPEPPPPPPPPPITTKPSPTSDPPPPSADSVRFDRADSDSLRAGGAPREEPRSEPGGAGLPPSVGAPKAAGAPTFAVRIGVVHRGDGFRLGHRRGDGLGECCPDRGAQRIRERGRERRSDRVGQRGGLGLGGSVGGADGRPRIAPAQPGRARRALRWTVRRHGLPLRDTTRKSGATAHGGLRQAAVLEGCRQSGFGCARQVVERGQSSVDDVPEAQ